jgi:hydrogenase-4 membrane subunit HyfE
MVYSTSSSSITAFRKSKPPSTPFQPNLINASDISADLTYLNFVVGVLVMFCFIPVQTWFYARDRRNHGHNRPEARFLVSLVTVWLFPITLLWFAFTSDGNTSYWSPIVAGAVLGFADPLLWLSMLNYITGM